MTNKNSLHFRMQIKQTGFTQLVSPANSALKIISLDLLALNADDVHSFPSDNKEKVLVILGGNCSVCFNGHEGETSIGKRKSVFEGSASAVYVPSQYPASIKAITRCEIAVVQAPSTLSGLRPRIIDPADVQEKVVGNNNWMRNVYDIIGRDFPAHRLIVGETINPPGNWSSSPPHRHELDNLPYESRFEEVYFYRVEPPQGFGLQRVYTGEGDLDVSYVVKHNDIVVLPRGYHPVVAAPGYKLYYLWVLAGKGRDAVWFEDPDHRWIHKLD